MRDANEIRKEVSRAYAKAVTTAAKRGCGCGCSAPSAKGAVIESAGYAEDKLAALPEGAVENAFGCGDPVAFSGIAPGDVVLDLGSGAGIDLLLAAEKVGPTGRVIGVDMTDEMIARAREHLRQAGASNVEIRKGLIEALPVQDASVDWVISNCVINLSPEKPRVFAEIARVLRPGGRMLVSDIVVEDLPAWIRESAAAYSACVAGAISEPEYLDGLRAAGLADAEVRARLVYDAEQLGGFLAGDSAETACCGGKPLPEERLRPMLESVAGKIWSAKIFARKPR